MVWSETWDSASSVIARCLKSWNLSPASAADVVVAFFVGTGLAWASALFLQAGHSIALVRLRQAFRKLFWLLVGSR